MIVLLSFLLPAAAQEPFRAEEVVSGLDSPWSVAFLPGGRTLFTLKDGAFLHIGPDGTRTRSTVPGVSGGGQGGLLDVLPANDFASSGVIYYSFSTGTGGRRGTALGRAVVDGSGRVGAFRTLWEMEERWKSAAGHHFGSRLAFDKEGYLYMTTGDRGDGRRAQNPEDPAGSVLRFDLTKPSSPRTFTTGHRNAQGLALHPETGELWLHEHGPKGGDEINILKEGGNYGWPLLTYGVNYNGSVISERSSASGYEDPLLHWTPSIAPSGMAFYRGSLYAGALAGRQLRRVKLDGGRPAGEEVLFKDRLGRIRDVRLGPDGLLYILQDGGGASLFRLRPTTAAAD